MDKFILRTKSFKRVENDLKESLGNIKLLEDAELFDESSEFYLPSLHNCALYISSYEAWQEIRSLHKQNKIHIGLRKFNYYDVLDLPHLTISGDVYIVLSRGFKNNEDPKFEYFKYGNFVNDIKLPSYDIVDLKDIEPCIARLDREEFLGFDFETHGFPLRSDFYPLGLSIVGSEYGFYVHLRDYKDFNDEIYKPLKDFIFKNYKRLVVFNCSFEIRVIYHMWEEFLLFPDAYVIEKCNDFKRGLKLAAQKELKVPSWDDELDDEIEVFKELFREHETVESALLPYNLHRSSAMIFVKEKAKIEYLSQIDDGIDKEVAKENYRNYILGYVNRLRENYWYEWAIVDPEILGKYCVLDSYYTKLIWDKLYKKYPKAVEPYHNNAYLGAMIETSGIPINRKKVEFLIPYYERIIKNSRIFFNRLYLRMLEDQYSELFNSLTISDQLIEVIKQGLNSVKSPVNKILKNVLKECVHDNIVSWKEVNNKLGPEIIDALMENINDFQDPSSVWRKRKPFEKATEIYSKQLGLSEFIRSINEPSIEKIKPYIKEFNDMVRKYCAKQNPRMCKICGEFIDKGLPLDSLKQQYPMIPNEAFYKVKSYYDRGMWTQFDSICGYVTKDMIEGWKDSVNYKREIPRILYYSLPQDLCSVEEVCHWVQLKSRENDYSHLDKISITEDYIGEEDPDTLANEILNWNSADDCLMFTELFIKQNGALLSAMTNYFDYRWGGGFKEGDDETEAIQYFVDHIKELPKYNLDVQSYLSLTNLKCKTTNETIKSLNLSDQFGFQDGQIRKWHNYNIDSTTKMNVEKDQYDNIYKFFIYWNLSGVAMKQISPYMTRLDEDSRKTTKELKRGALIIDESQLGDQFLVGFQVNMKDTKRWSLTKMGSCTSNCV